VRTRPGAIAEADRKVEALGGQIDEIVVRQHAQLDERMERVKGLEPRHEPSHGKGAHGADRQHLVKMAAFELPQYGFDAIERVAEHRAQRESFVGHGKTARQALEQRDTEPLLERAHLLAHRGLRDIQLLRGAREAQMPDCRFEGAQRIQG